MDTLRKQFLRHIAQTSPSPMLVEVERAEGSCFYTPEGKEQVKEMTGYYMRNAQLMKHWLDSTGLKVSGGENAPYLWVKAPKGFSSWQFFEHLLYNAHVVSTPGIGFGPNGEGYVRLTAFGDRQECEEGMKRICQHL